MPPRSLFFVLLCIGLVVAMIGALWYPGLSPGGALGPPSAPESGAEPRNEVVATPPPTAAEAGFAGEGVLGESTSRRLAPMAAELADPPATAELVGKLRERARHEDRLGMVVVEVLSAQTRWSGMAVDGSRLKARFDNESVRLVALTANAGLRIAPFEVLEVRHRPARNKRRHGFAQPLGRLAAGDVREVLLSAAGPGRNPMLELLWAGPRRAQPDDMVPRDMPRAMFVEMQRGASVFRGRVRSRSQRSTDPARQRLGFPARVDVALVEVLEVVHSQHDLVPGAVVQLDRLPVVGRAGSMSLPERPALEGPLGGLGEVLRRGSMSPLLSAVASERIEPGAVSWFAVGKSWRSLAIRNALP